jgi:uncharacterized protein (TIGR03086 family)
VHDIEPAAMTMAGLVRAVPEERLGDPTPAGMSVGAVVDHVRTFAGAFTRIARKEQVSQPTPPDADRLGPGWREQILADLDGLVGAWREPEAWQGEAVTGGAGTMPAEVAGLVTLDELVLHGWDLATAIDHPFHVRPEDVDAAIGFVTAFEAPRDGRLFGPVVAVPDDAPPLDRLLGLAGRDPAWAG